MANSKQEIKYTKLFIDNEFVDAKSGKTFETVNPATGEVLANVAEGDKADVDFAVEAAKRAFARGSVWRNLDASARGRLLYKLADLVDCDIDIIANLISLDNGKTFDDAVGEIQESVKVLRYYAGYTDKIHGKTIPSDNGFFSMTRREPIGIVGQIIPWNFPVMMLVWKWAPSIASGCVSILKPAELTPLSALYIAALSKEAGFPNGVLNIINGYGPTAGQAIAAHPEIRKIAFTGSTVTGKLIMATAASTNLKRVSLELGGKSPLVIWSDADVNEAAQIAHEGLFFNHGQCCIAASRTYVHEDIYDAFVKRSKELIVSRKVGNPFAKGTQQGPQINEVQMNKILAYIESGKKQGAVLETGGNRIGTTGFYVEPTLFSNVADDMTIAKEEIFGPVQSILKFKTLEEVLERANNSNFGLASGIITKDLDVALVFAKGIEAGQVWVNHYAAFSAQAAFGGYKESGHGRELGDEGLELYLETKTISIKLPANTN